jgi:hypothetical protein
MTLPRSSMWAAAFLAAASVSAHDFWIEPSTFRPTLGSRVKVSLLVGENLAGERVSFHPARVERFAAMQNDRETAIDGELTVTSKDMIRVIYRSRPSAITLEADKFEQYLREEGLERIIATRAARGHSDTEGREIFSRCAKALLRPPGGSGKDRPSGLRLEIIAESQRSFLVRYREAPLEGALVVAINATGQAVFRARSDAAGRVTFPLRQRGLWLVKTVHMIDAPPGGEADWESLWASLTFEVP